MSAFELTDKYTVDEGTIYLTGQQALVRLLLDQARSDRRRGLTTGGFVSGYPGSPVGGLDLELERRRALLDEYGIRHQAGLNEDLAATAAFGSQLTGVVPDMTVDGVFAMWFGKAPGLDRSADAIRHGNYRGTLSTGGLLAVAGDDPQPSSSILPSDSSRLFADLFMPVLVPADVQDVLDLGLHGYALSRFCGLAVGFKFITAVADASQSVQVGPSRIEPNLPQLEFGGRPFVPTMTLNETGPRLVAREREIQEQRLPAAIAYARANGLNRVRGSPSQGSLGIVTSGRAYLDVVEALRRLGMDPSRPELHGVRILKLGMVWPVDREQLVEFATGLTEVLVVEDKRPWLEAGVRDALYAMLERPSVVGKRDEVGQELLPVESELTPDQVERAITRRLARLPGYEHFARRQPSDSARELVVTSEHEPESLSVSTVARTPHFCSGCPHNRGLQVPEGSIVGAGIGCHVMQVFMDKPDYGQVLGYTHMGGEGSQWVGLAPFTDGDRHIFQNLGDGTFSHSGSLAVRFAVSAGVNITYKVLHNSAVAMTGGQDVTGGFSVGEMAHLLAAERVKKIAIVTENPAQYRRTSLPSGAEVHHRERILDVERDLASTPGVTVLIHDQHCAAEVRRLRKRNALPSPQWSVVINERLCEGCGDCAAKSNCLSVQPVDTVLGRKTAIHQSSCNFDYSCVRGDCPSFMRVVGMPIKAARTQLRIPADLLLDDPAPSVPVEDFAIHMSGIGGTGVVTVNQLLATAALLDGRSVRGLDKMGGSQKAGPVTSHLRVSDHPVERTCSVSDGQADVILLFDLLVGTDARNLAKADRTRTRAVVSTSAVPTGSMVVDPTLSFPSVQGLVRLVERRTRAGENHYLDAQALAEAAFGDHMAANLILVGAAYQAGFIPISESSILRSIELNGVAVDLNKEAFRFGRVVVARPDLIAGVDVPETGAALPGDDDPHWAEVGDVLGAVDDGTRHAVWYRFVDLTGYQDIDYARTYLRQVGRVHDAELATQPGSTALTQAVATGLHKVMAYKDEYEVARLCLDEREAAKVAATFGPDAKVFWLLHPPVLRWLGVNRKIRIGRWFEPAFVVLYWLRWLRPTRLDLFGYTKVRRAERRLRDDYFELVQTLVSELTPERHALAVEAAQLIDQVRGYEDIKMSRIDAYHAELDLLLHSNLDAAAQ